MTKYYIDESYVGLEQYDKEATMVSIAEPPAPPTQEEIAAIEDFLTGLTELTRKTGIGPEVDPGYYEGEGYLSLEQYYGLEDHFYVINSSGHLSWINKVDTGFWKPVYVARQGR